MMISFFKSRNDKKPSASIPIDKFIDGIINGEWKTIVERYQATNDRRLKDRLPGVTISGCFTSRDKAVEVSKRLKEHSGFICLDIDRKDNENLRIQNIVDREAYAQFKSCSGEGLKIIYRCVKTKDPAEHRRIYDGLLARLVKKKIQLKVDPIVKSIASLQYVSYDAEGWHNPKTKFVAKPLAPVRKNKKIERPDAKSELVQLQDYVKALGTKDITKDYNDWLNLLFGISYSLGEQGRKLMHTICKNYKGYSKAECDEKFDGCLERNMEEVTNPVTIASVYQLISSNLPKAKLKELEKKYKKSHAVGIGEDEEQEDLVGMVRYKLFLFKKIYDKETNTLVELIPTKINLNAFEQLLQELGFMRYEDMYIRIVDNIVEVVDEGDILRTVTLHIENEGNYTFTYKQTEFNFNWEELIHLWRESRATGRIAHQLKASLKRWEPNILRDTATDSYIPYRNGVVHVTAKSIKLVPYSQVKQQIWRERILPRDFRAINKVGMFEEFFANINGRDRKAKRYKKALWYYGYILQGTKRQSTARAWLLYDSRTGKNGRTGKTIIGNAVGKIRNVVYLDGKQVDFRNRFVFQTIQPWSNVIFIDDPYKTMSLDPIFNIITGNVYADRKGLEPLIKDDLKVMIASNWILENTGESEKGRQFVTQLDDFYVQWGKENGDTIMPIVKFHGKEFFTDWNEEDWRCFDTFSLKAIQFHLATAPPEATVVGNAAKLRFIQMHDEDMHVALLNELKLHAVKSNGHVLVPKGVLVDAVKDFDNKTTTVTAGKIVRHWFSSIGADKVTVASTTKGAVSTMLYKIEKPWEELELK